MDVATEEHETLHGVLVTESAFQETEEEFSGKFQPTTKSADISIEEGKNVQIVSEVLVKEKEGLFSKFVTPEERKAKSDITGREVAQITEITAETNLEYIPTEVRKEISASVTQLPYEAVIQHQILPQESEDTLTSKNITITKSAEILFEEGRSLTVTQVVTEDKEAPYSIDEMKYQTAKPEILGKEVAEKIEVYSEFGLSDLQTTAPKEMKATSGCVTFESLSQSETIVREKESEYAETFKPDGHRASIHFEEGKGVTIIEIITDDKEGDLLKFEKPIEQKAHSDISGQEIAQIYEVMTCLLYTSRCV